MSDRITRTDFRALFQDAVIDVNDLKPETQRALESVGLSVDDLRSVADTSGKITGQLAADQLFLFLDDRLDYDGSLQTIIESDPASPLQAGLTKAGVAIQALSDERKLSGRIRAKDFVARHTHGGFDLSRLTPADTSRLKALGLDMAALGRLDSDNLVSDSGALQRLFVLIDRLDKDGSPQTLATTTLHRAEETFVATASGQAMQILDNVFRPYDQQFTSYVDLSRALIDTSVSPVSIDVKHIPQTDATGCLDISTDMVKSFDPDAAAQLPAGAWDAYYMVRGEDSNGSIVGFRDEFQLGREIVDFTLDHGRPVIVGLSHSAEHFNLDAITDHFVVITGRRVDEEGRVYYDFQDPATSGQEFSQGRFYVDKDSGMLFRPPACTTDYPFFLNYQVTQVRPYADMVKPEWQLARRNGSSVID